MFRSLPLESPRRWPPASVKSTGTGRLGFGPLILRSAALAQGSACRVRGPSKNQSELSERGVAAEKTTARQRGDAQISDLLNSAP